MQRRGFLKTLCAGIGAGLGLLGPTGQGPAEVEAKPQRKKRPDHKRGDGNPDGKNTVNGALWQFTATDTISNKQVSFRYRATDFTLYNLETGEIIGTTKALKQKRSLVTLNDKCPFPGRFEIRLLRLSHWVGQLKTDEADWIIKLTCLDR